MRKTLKFNSVNNEVVENENLSGLYFRFKPLKADGVTLADLQNMHQLRVKLVLVRNGQDLIIHDGNLRDLNVGLYNQTPQYFKNITAVDKIYEMFFFFGNLRLTGKDRLEIQFEPQNTAFTALSVANSDVSIETIPTDGYETDISTVDFKVVGNNEVEFDESLGNGITGVCIVTDYDNNITESAQAKVESVQLETPDARVDISGNLAYALDELKMGQLTNSYGRRNLNIHSGKKIDKARLKFKLDGSATTETKVVIQRGIPLRLLQQTSKVTSQDSLVFAR